MFRKLLILSASAGAGHVRAAEAIERAVRDLGAAREVRHIDVLELTTKVFRALYSKAYIDMVNRAPEVLGWLYDPIPGQEERNADHLLEEGAALRSNNLPALAYKVQRLLDDPARFEAMRANARRLARPDAARDIVRRLVELGGSGAWAR